jgi:hypothetical protein
VYHFCIRHPLFELLLSAITSFLTRREYTSRQNGIDKCKRKGFLKLKTFIVYDLDSKMPVAVGEEVSAETARYCASVVTGTFQANLFAEEIEVQAKCQRFFNCQTRTESTRNQLHGDNI